MAGLRIASDLQLPVDVAGEAVGILATRGAGKSFTSAVLVEELWRAKVQFAVLDPTGVYWGLRAAANGRDAGLPVIVLGGAHGDVPLEPTAGKLVADLLVDTGQSLILDLSDFETKGAQTRFVTDLAERLYPRKARNRSTLHLVIDEAHEFAPQKPMRDEARMLGAMERLVGRGRSRGIGTTLITQRSATLNKNVLDLVDTLVAMRVLSPRDRGAVKDWITVKEERDELGVLESLPGLPTGTAWIWSPVRQVLKKVKVRRIRTFDSYATPKPGQKRAEPRQLAPIDVAALGKEIAATKERQEAADPARLQRRIRELGAELRKRPTETKVETVLERVEVPALTVVERDHLERVIKAADQARDAMDAVLPVVRAILGRGEAFGRGARQEPERTSAGQRMADDAGKRAPARPMAPTAERSQPTSSAAPAVARPPAPPPDADGITGPQQRVLNACAWLAHLGLAPASKLQVAFIAGYKPNTGTFNNVLGSLRSMGLIEYPRPNTVGLTEAGDDAAHWPDFAGSTAELHQAVLSKLTGPQRRVLEVLIGRYPEQIAKDDLAAAAGYTPNTGTYNNVLGSLRSLGVIDYPSAGWVVALPVLFLEEASA